MGSRDAFLKFYHFGKGHDSPNSGHPISAMALSIGVKLGGNTYYFGELKEKPHFGLGKLKIDDMGDSKSLELHHRFGYSHHLVLPSIRVFLFFGLISFLTGLKGIPFGSLTRCEGGKEFHFEGGNY